MIIDFLNAIKDKFQKRGFEISDLRGFMKYITSIENMNENDESFSIAMEKFYTHLIIKS